MNRIHLYRLLRRNAKLGEKRHPALEQSTVAKVMLYIGAGLMMIYLIFPGSVLGRIAAEEDLPVLMLIVLPFFLVLDFLFRFIGQQTPLVFVKPYLLMPVRAQHVTELYLLNQVLSSYNLLWLALLLPYAYICLVAGMAFWSVVGVVVGGLFMVMANAQWYLLVRTLIVRSVLWWALPALVAAVTAAVIYLIIEADLLDVVSGSYAADALLIWVLALLALAALVGLFLLNLRLQQRFIVQELAREEKRPAAIRHVTQLSFLNRFGLAGEYLKLELKSIMRNKAIRSRVVMSLSLIVMLSLLISYTNVYDGKMVLNFWCYYCFALYGMTALTKVMGPEGNYIDLLMTQHENILLLLRAKYYFHVAILLVPLVIMLPAVISGKFTVMMMLAYLLLTSGLGYLVMFQLAVYNKQTLPLDAKLTGKNNMESGLQLIIELVGMFLPLLLVGLTLLLTDDDTAYLIMTLLGLVLTLTHGWWLRNIYNRMMKRKYQNLEGFHASRS